MDSELHKISSEALLSIEWQHNGGGTYTCQGCGGWAFNKIHNKDCLVDKALTALGYPTPETRNKALGELNHRINKERYGF